MQMKRQKELLVTGYWCFFGDLKLILQLKTFFLLETSQSVAYDDETKKI
jgi:hypothetical protein